MRLKVPDRTGYIVKSTKETDALLAEDTARKEYASLAYKIENNLEMRNMIFPSSTRLGGKGRNRPNRMQGFAISKGR